MAGSYFHGNIEQDIFTYPPLFMAASRFAASTELDLNAIAEQAQVDAILTGTILSDGEHLRVSNQLIEAPSGTVRWSNSSQVSLRDIFQLQDELVDRIVQSLTPPLTARERLALKHDVPASAMAYEYYLRANQLAAAAAVGDVPNMSLARDLYLRCVDLDPQYAPAWAGLGRAHRFIGKVGEVNAHNLARAEEAFRKAFALNPDLALAHNFYTSLQTDLGQSLDAMERLLKRAHERSAAFSCGLRRHHRRCAWTRLDGTCRAGRARRKQAATGRNGPSLDGKPPAASQGRARRL